MPDTPQPHDGLGITRSDRQGVGVFLARHSTAVFVGLIVLVMVVLQWPMIKGAFYKVSGMEAPTDGIPWRRDLALAMQQAKESGKPILADFTASWCPPCRVMKHDVWPDETVRRLASDNFIPALFDSDDPQAQETFRRYQVQAIPTILVLDTEGNVLHRVNFLDRDQMVRFLERTANLPG